MEVRRLGHSLFVVLPRVSDLLGAEVALAEYLVVVLGGVALGAGVLAHPQEVVRTPVHSGLGAARVYQHCPVVALAGARVTTQRHYHRATVGTCVSWSEIT